MAFNLDKLAEMAIPRNEEAKKKARFRRDNREWLSMSHDIAFAVLHYLRTHGLTQKDLADKMGVSPAYVGKLLKGNENMTIETICKLQKALNQTLVSIAQPYVTTSIIELRPKHVMFSEEAVESSKYCGQQTFNANNGVWNYGAA